MPLNGHQAPPKDIFYQSCPRVGSRFLLILVGRVGSSRVRSGRKFLAFIPLSS